MPRRYRPRVVKRELARKPISFSDKDKQKLLDWVSASEDRESEYLVALHKIIADYIELHAYLDFYPVSSRLPLALGSLEKTYKETVAGIRNAKKILTAPDLSKSNSLFQFVSEQDRSRISVDFSNTKNLPGPLAKAELFLSEINNESIPEIRNWESQMV